MPVSFMVDAFPNQQFSGTVRQIRNSAQTIQNVVTYDAVIDVGNSELKLKPGMTANIEFVVATQSNVIRIPNTALLFRPDPTLLQRLHIAVPQSVINLQSATRTIWVLRNGKPEPVFVRTGISDGSFTAVILGDIQPGDALITDMTANSKSGLL
jgi:HlyD family secretion protein